MRFDDKVVLVSGAGAGIGRAAALQFARAGAKVAATSLTPAHGEKTLEMIKAAGNHDAVYIQGDVATDAEKIVAETVKAFGRLDVLINNAGIVLGGRVDTVTEADFDKTMEVNVKGVFMLAKYAVIQMKKQGGGVIVNNASIAAIKGVRDRSVYSASKGAITALTRAMAIDHIKENIRVNCICPGTVMTESLQVRINTAPDPGAAMKMFVERQPMGRLGQPEEIANAMLFLAWDKVGFMNGVTLSVDGGMGI